MRFSMNIFFERGEEYPLHQVGLLDLELTLEEAKRLLGVDLQDLAHLHELRLVIDDHARVRRNTDLAVGEGIKGIDGNLRATVPAASAAGSRHSLPCCRSPALL